MHIGKLFIAAAILAAPARAQNAIDLASPTQVKNILPKAHGGTGTASPGIIAGSNVTVTGTWPNQTIGTDVAPAGAAGAVQYQTDTGAFGGDAAKLIYYPSLLTPSAPGVTTNGSTGTSTYGYKVAFRTLTGHSDASSETVIATGNATLDTSNYNVITAPACTLEGVSVDVYRTTADLDNYTLGLLKNIPCTGSVNDDGTLGPNNESPPAADSARGVRLNGAFVSTGYSSFGSLADIGYARSGLLSTRQSQSVIEQFVQPNFSTGLLIDASINPSDDTSSIAGAEISARSLETNSHFQNVYGLVVRDQYRSTGSGSMISLPIYADNLSASHIFEMDGAYSSQSNSDAAGVIDAAYGMWTGMQNSGSIGSYYGYYVQPLANNPPGVTDKAFGVWIGDQSTATNGYALWYDGPGNAIWRVRADGVVAFYNPAYATRYTPGGTDFERIVTQWNSDVAEIGTEKGTTGGSVRPLRLLATATANVPQATSSLPTCTAGTGSPWRASVTDALLPSLGAALTGGGAVFANVHCSLTTGTYLVDGL